MSENEKRELEENYKTLKTLIDFHTTYRNIIWVGKEKEYQEYINAILDEMIMIRKKIDKYE